MKYRVILNKKNQKSVQKLPGYEKKVFDQLVKDLTDTGPIQKDWNNFSLVEKNKYHCHLSYKWVACRYNEKKHITIEVYYVGSREKAPY